MNFKDDTIGSVSFSDAMCSGVTGLKMDILFTPVGGLVCLENTTSRIIIRRFENYPSGKSSIGII
jgi:hypothetical protein